MNLTQVFNDFVNVLMNYTGILTEDSIRYFFFAKMYDQDNNLQHYTLELPYQQLLTSTQSNGLFPAYINSSNNLTFFLSSNREMDLFYDDGNDCFCIEIKFHRNGLTNTAFPYPDAAGSLFDDIKRLQLIQGKRIKWLFLYVTDTEMYKYLSSQQPNKHQNYRKELQKIVNTNVGQVQNIKFQANTCPITFLRSSNSSFFNKKNISINNTFAPNVTFKVLNCMNNIQTNSISILESPKNFGCRPCYVRLIEII